ncbi:WD-40 repeat protein [Reticulomyxa filosa]|uniref:WD-40 repeat protein n=1 Tax=Reticulomyxa filosa TaxID=46433 RepID=X6M181_RETFI|nr:WD-40 repeat protein [Reticulomyxa filosa]|eukprot:ETO07644.1 WD-40 repeat protein [Reticulomyxa filosa]
MATPDNEKKISTQLTASKEEGEEIQLIIQHWIRILNIKLGWIHDFDKFVVNYVCILFFKYLFDTFTGHTNWVNSIDYSTFDDNQFICSGSEDSTIRVWDIETYRQVRLFNQSSSVNCVRFSPYHYYNNHRRNVICFSSDDKAIHFYDIKDNRQFQIFNGHTNSVFDIEFSPFNGGRYLCSGSRDNTICLWDVETSESLCTFNGHGNWVWCVDFSSLQSNNKNNSISGSGYTICSGSSDSTIRIWDIETTKQLLVLNGHKYSVWCIKYGSNELGNSGGANTILSGSMDRSIRLWDIRSGQQIQIFSEHKGYIYAVEYSPFIVKNIEIGGCSNVICSGSTDNTIRFWDIRSNKNELYLIKASNQEENGIKSLKFIPLKKKEQKNNNNGINLCYGSLKGLICIWG